MIPEKKGRETGCQGTRGNRFDITITSNNQLNTSKNTIDSNELLQITSSLYL